MRWNLLGRGGDYVGQLPASQLVSVKQHRYPLGRGGVSVVSSLGRAGDSVARLLASLPVSIESSHCTHWEEEVMPWRSTWEEEVTDSDSAATGFSARFPGSQHMSYPFGQR
jgi:hypothetical protein